MDNLVTTLSNLFVRRQSTPNTNPSGSANPHPGNAHAHAHAHAHSSSSVSTPNLSSHPQHQHLLSSAAAANNNNNNANQLRGQRTSSAPPSPVHSQSHHSQNHQHQQQHQQHQHQQQHHHQQYPGAVRNQQQAPLQQPIASSYGSSSSSVQSSSANHRSTRPAIQGYGHPYPGPMAAPPAGGPGSSPVSVTSTNGYSPQHAQAQIMAAHQQQQQQQLKQQAEPMSKANCQCCRTELTFPQSVVSFRCSVCDYINDLMVLPPPPTTPESAHLNHPLTLSGLREFLARKPSTPIISHASSPASASPPAASSADVDSVFAASTLGRKLPAVPPAAMTPPPLHSTSSSPTVPQPPPRPGHAPSSTGSTPPNASSPASIAANLSPSYASSPSSNPARLATGVQPLAYSHQSALALDLSRYLRHVFSQWHLLNASLLVDVRRAGAKPDGILVNLYAAQEAWKLIVAQPHAVHVAVLSAMQHLLMRLGRTVREAGELGWLVIMLECPLLRRSTWSASTSPADDHLRLAVLSRLLGHLSALPNHLHYHLVEWSLEWSADDLTNKVDLMNQFLTFRLKACQPPRHELGEDGRLLAQHYTQDWQIIAVCRSMALLFSSNNKNRRIDLSTFYNTMVDLRVHLLRDFDAWERRQLPFSFCQYPFTLSLAAKLTLMDFEAKRAMFHKFREAVAAQGMAEIAQSMSNNASDMGGALGRATSTRRPGTAAGAVGADGLPSPGVPTGQGYFPTREQQMPFVPLHIRRTHLVEDSLAQLADPHVDLKKRIRVQFAGEEGIDAGGLLREWLLLLVKDLFDAKYGMWVEPNPGSGVVWFNPACGDLQEYYLVGVVVGLAVYNSTILEVPLASPGFKKLLKHPVGMGDLKVLDPDLVHGLNMLLEYTGDDVEDVFCREFVGEFEAYGQVYRVPLVDNGANIPVTKANRKEFVTRLVEFKLTTSVARQFDSFYNGVLRVLQGNALSLFRPEEIELLVRGSVDVDVAQLEVTAEYDGGFSEGHPTVRDLWEVLRGFDAVMRGKFLKFLTGTDRVPATGVTLKIVCLGHEDSDRLPVAHTCFNQLGLYTYWGRDKLRRKLVMAVLESEGFGIK